MVKRKVALISEEISHVHQLAKSLVTRGFLVDIYTRRNKDTLPFLIRSDTGIRLIHVPAGPAKQIPNTETFQYMPQFEQWVRRFIVRQKQRYEIIHAHFYTSGFVAMELKRYLEVPFIVTFHELGKPRREQLGDTDLHPDIRLSVEEQVIQKADCVIAQSPQDHADLLSLYKAPPASIAMIPRGYDPAELAPIDKGYARTVLGLPGDVDVILSCGGQAPHNGIDDVIRAVALLRRGRNITTRLLIVGGGLRIPEPERSPELGRLQMVAAEEEVLDLVSFVGQRKRDELKYFYNAADVFACSPWYAPLGVTALEAMACGVPVVGSDLGSISFPVADGVTGYLVPPKNPAAISEKLGILLQSPERRAACGKQGAQRAYQLFRLETTNGALIETYERVVRQATVLGRKSRKPSGSLTVNPGYRPTEYAHGRVLTVPEK